MIVENRWQVLFDHELQQAISARANGNEGMARVCARRAAGILIGEYLARQGVPFSEPSAHDRLRFILTMPGLSPAIKEVVHHLLLRITPERSLPVQVDLIAEVGWLRDALIEG